MNFLLIIELDKHKDINPKLSSFDSFLDLDLENPTPKAIIKGIVASGANVVNLGLVPTPLGYYSEIALPSASSHAAGTSSFTSGSALPIN